MEPKLDELREGILVYIRRFLGHSPFMAEFPELGNLDFTANFVADLSMSKVRDYLDILIVYNLASRQNMVKFAKEQEGIKAKGGTAR